MFSVTVEASFHAQHQIRLPDGTLEPLHGHDWQVRARFDARQLDPLDMVVDFSAAQGALREIIADFHHANLNRIEAFAGTNPTAERVAELIYRRLERAGLKSAAQVEVTEAPGCTAAFRPAPAQARQLEPGGRD